MSRRGRPDAPAAVAVLSAALAVALWPLPPPPRLRRPAVRAVLFFSPTCGHCEYVINELLFPVWFPQFGGEPRCSGTRRSIEPAFFLATNGTLEILLVDVSVAGRPGPAPGGRRGPGHPGGRAVARCPAWWWEIAT